MRKESKTWKMFYLNDKKDTHRMERDDFTLQGLKDLAARVRKLNKDPKKLMLQLGAPPPSHSILPALAV